MKTARLVLCVTGAIIGAGFASGREIMTFFSEFGSFSWALVCLAVCAITLLICKTMRCGAWVALTIPVRYARGMGMTLSLALCLLAIRRPLRLMEGLGRLLIPLLTVAFVLCRGVAPAEA